MQARVQDRSPPKAALIGAGLIMAMTIVIAAVAPKSPHVTPSFVDAVQTRQLRFVDQGDGAMAFGGHVRVFDQATGAELPPVAEKEGFVRATLNGLAFERSKRALNAPTVLTLALWPKGRLTLEDPATGRHIDVGEFGAGNKSVFLRFLNAGGSAS